MTLQPGTRLGPYEVIAQIGVGGMGEVYRATDTNLARQVAIKVLPEAVAADADRLARFDREAKTLAALNHPNIAAIYGLERSGPITALVMELVSGETLADRIARGPIPVDEALPIARQICEALEAAHEQGIIHRDLKPANVKLRPDGTVKVLDFGLAKAVEPTGAISTNASMSPTITSPAMMTRAGMILGTAAYMAPEQARGKAVDKRSDIWAFGAVLFEMLTGARAFPGDEVSDVLASVLAREPNWAQLPASLSPTLGLYIRRSLNKDSKQRIGDIRDVRLALEGAFEAADPSAGPFAARSRVAIVAASALGVGAIVAGALVWFAMRAAPLVPAPIWRVTISPQSQAEALTVNGVDRDLAITPDGSRVIYVGNGGTQLFVRALDALEPVAVFNGLPHGPFVSPDGQWIGFFDGLGTLKRVAVTGGPAITIASLGNSASRGAAWASDNTIIFASDDPTTGLVRVAVSGGPTTVLTTPDRGRGETDHYWPEILPGGRALLFTVIPLNTAGNPDASQVGLLDLQTGVRRILLNGGSHAHYLSSGHLVYAAGGTLRAVPFDLASLEIRGAPVPAVPTVVTQSTGALDAAVAGNGTLAYVNGGDRGNPSSSPRTLVWVDRQGRETPIPAPPRAYVSARLSPDGTRVATWASDQDSDIWLWDLRRGTLTRVTFEPGIDNNPAWTPDGRRLLFSSARAGARNLFWEAADGTGVVERLTESPSQKYQMDVSPDGRWLIFTEANPKTAEDLMQLELGGSHQATPLVQSSFSERNPVISPDGHWLAYEADDSGRLEIYVRPFPEVNRGRWQVSTAGGTGPLWAPNGQELFYVAPTGALMRVGVERSSSWAATAPTLLIKEGYFTIPRFVGTRTYDVSRDGQRFLMIKEGRTDQTASPPQIIVVQHFDEELKRLVPTK